MPLIHHFFANTSLSLFPFYIRFLPHSTTTVCSCSHSHSSKIECSVYKQYPTASVVYLKVGKLNFTKYHENDCEIRQTGPKWYKQAT